MSDPADRPGPTPSYRAALTAQARPDRTLLAIMLLAIAALAGTIALLPGSEEKAEGLMAEGRYADAIQILVAAEDERPLDAYESYMLFKLYMLTRQPDNAAVLIGREPALQTDNAWALRQLSDLYRELRNLPGEADFLRRLYDISPTEADFARLRILYRLTGDRAGEASLLAQAIAAGRLDESHMERLTYLQSVPGPDVKAAIWVAPARRYPGLDDMSPVHILALSDLIDPSTPKSE